MNEVQIGLAYCSFVVKESFFLDTHGLFASQINNI